VKHYLDVDPSEAEKYSSIILSGTTLKDFEFLKHLENFRWIKTCTKPILGICAGMQTIIRVYGEQLVPCQQIGMTEITTTKLNPLFSGDFKPTAYTPTHSYWQPHLRNNSQIIQMHPSSSPQREPHLRRPLPPRSTQPRHPEKIHYPTIAPQIGWSGDCRKKLKAETDFFILVVFGGFLFLITKLPVEKLRNICDADLFTANHWRVGLGVIIGQDRALER
jgi:hypothetical protein